MRHLRRSGAVVPYLGVASGLLWRTDRLDDASYTSQGGTVDGEGGVRIDVGQRAFLPVEGRIGLSPWPGQPPRSLAPALTGRRPVRHDPPSENPRLPTLVSSSEPAGPPVTNSALMTQD